MRRFAKSIPVLAIFFLVKSVSAANCDTIINHGLRNIEVSKSSEAASAVKYFAHCQTNFQTLSKESLGSVEISILGQGGASGGLDKKKRSERLEQWCTANRHLETADRAGFHESQVFYQGAVTAWEKCVSHASHGIRIDPVISPDARTVNIGLVHLANTKSGVLLYGVRSEGFTCKITGPRGREPTLPIEVRNLSVQISCLRDSPRRRNLNGETYEVLSRGTITVETASDPFQLYFPEEWDPGLPIREAARMRLAVISSELPVGTVISSALPPEQFASPHNVQYSASKWVIADGRALPVGTVYEKITGKKNAPDMRIEQRSFNILDIVSSPMGHGLNVQSATSELGKDGQWKWFASGRDLHGNMYNDDDQHAMDHFETYIDDNGFVIAHGRTHNFRHGVYGGWRNGSANLLGVSISKKTNYYYVKIN